MPDLGEPLSPRELDVLHELYQGLTNKEVADTLSISPNTVKVHVRNIFTKLGASSRTEAVTLAIQHGLVDSGADEKTIDIAPLAVEVEANGRQPLSAAAAPLPSLQQPAAPQPAPGRPLRTFSAVGALLLLLLLLLILFYIYRPDLARVNAAPFVEETLELNGWSTVQPLPAPRRGLALASVGLNLYQVGGQTVDGIDGNTAIFDTRARQWLAATAKPTPVTDAASAVLADQIYVIGGATATAPTAVVEVYSPSGDAWRSVAQLPQPAVGGAAAVLAEDLYFFGGQDGDDYLASAYVYSAMNNSWRPLPSMSQPRAFAAAAAADGSVYVLGGLNEAGETDLCERYDPAAAAWIDCPSLLEPRAGAVAVALFDRIYLIGGGITRDLPFGELYDKNSGAWQVINIPDSIDGAGRWTGLGAAAVETRIYLIGGERDGQSRVDCYIYNPLPFQFYFPSTSSNAPSE